jgi:D-aspartate ligase
MTSASELDPRRFRADRPPVVLLGGLNVLRALGLAGIPVILASTSAHEAAFASRYCRGQLRLPSLHGGRAIADRLLHAGQRLADRLGQRLPLFYSNDDWQRLVQDHRSELARHYTVLLNDADIADALLEKDRFQSLARARGLPVPHALGWDALERVAGPVLIKPRAKFSRDFPQRPRAARRRGRAAAAR